MRFEKWQALGNDYVIVEADNLPWGLTEQRIKRICEPHFGIGSDGILLLSRPESNDHVADLRIFNPDGSEAELSGNGAREAALYLRRRRWTDADEFGMRTAAGVVRPQILGPASAAMDIGRASTQSPDFPTGPPDGRDRIMVGEREWDFRHVHIGNPQCVIEVGGAVDQLDLPRVGPAIERDRRFPNRTNVSFTRRQGSKVRARIFERGVGETTASGTGASGAAVNAVLAGAQSPITVLLDGGELTVDVSPELDVRLTGTAEPVYAGEISEELANALAGLDDGPL
jgi:diaminopimelate epimerase